MLSRKCPASTPTGPRHHGCAISMRSQLFAPAPLHHSPKARLALALFLGPGRPSAGGAPGKMRIQAPCIPTCLHAPNPSLPSRIPVDAEVAIRTIPRIHACFRAADCNGHRLPVAQSQIARSCDASKGRCTRPSRPAEQLDVRRRMPAADATVDSVTVLEGRQRRPLDGRKRRSDGDTSPQGR